MPGIVAITGAAGQLASAIQRVFDGRHRVVPLTRSDLDITADDAVVTALGAIRPDLIVNCAGYNDVDAAEQHPVRALEVNAFGVRTLARAARALRAMLVHYSTDFVFDGSGNRPHTEDDLPNPQSVYAASKLLGEWFALEAPGAYVLRVESLFGAAGAIGRRSSLETIASGIAAGDEVPVFTDRTVSPSYVHDVAAATLSLFEFGAAGRAVPLCQHRRGNLGGDCQGHREATGQNPSSATADAGRRHVGGPASPVLRHDECETGRRRYRDADMAGCGRKVSRPGFSIQNSEYRIQNLTPTPNAQRPTPNVPPPRFHAPGREARRQVRWTDSSRQDETWICHGP
jgi:dTDP-4-dehydrorhamnose reductase